MPLVSLTVERTMWKESEGSLYLLRATQAGQLAGHQGSQSCNHRKRILPTICVGYKSDSFSEPIEESPVQLIA